MYKPSNLPPNFDFESKNILKKLADAKSSLGELKGIVQIIPNQSILINSLCLQEAKDSSEIENIITTQDEIFKAELDIGLIKNQATKEVQNYNLALQEGFKQVKEIGFIKNSCILSIQEVLEQIRAGYRKLSGTVIKSERTNQIIYTPPQDENEIKDLMSDFVDYLNDDDRHQIDPLIKMAIIHFQFESIHPFYDGNGRTGRILNILYLIQKGLLDFPILYMSRFIVQNKDEYYRRIQNVRDKNEWEDWIIFMLDAVRETSLDTVEIVKEIKNLMQYYKKILRDDFKSFYSQDLLNILFKHPYTKIEFLERDLNITRKTASKYLNEIEKHPLKLLEKVKIGKSNYFINVKLFDLFTKERNVIANPKPAVSSCLKYL